MDNKGFFVALRENHYLQILCGGWDIREKICSVSDIQTFVSNIVGDRPLPSLIFQLLDILEDNDTRASYAHLRVPASAYARYHRFPNLPSNFINIGDSVLYLNPIKGQRCTKACAEAVSFDGLLRKCPGGMNLPSHFVRDFFARQEKRTSRIWESAKKEDHGWQTTSSAKGDTLAYGKLYRALAKRVIELVQNDEASARVVLLVGGFLEPPTELVSPVILLKLLWHFTTAQIGL